MRSSPTAPAAPSIVLSAFVPLLWLIRRKKACLAFSRWGCIAPEPRRRQPEEAGDAAGRHIHGGDEEDAGNRPGCRFRDLIRDIWHELDKDGAEERARNRGDAAD